MKRPQARAELSNDILAMIRKYMEPGDEGAPLDATEVTGVLLATFVNFATIMLIVEGNSKRRARWKLRRIIHRYLRRHWRIVATDVTVRHMGGTYLFNQRKEPKT